MQNTVSLLLQLCSNCFIFSQKKQIETSQNQYKDLQAKYEKETSEMITKHDADIKGFKQNLLDAEEALKIAQKKNDELEKQAEELKNQAEQAKVCISVTSQVI